MVVSTFKSSLLMALSAVAVVSIVSGCSVSSPSNDTFGLTSTPTVQGKTRRHLQILVPEPTALKALDSEQVVVRVSPAELRYLAKAQWSDRLPKMVQAKLVQAFEATNLLGGVGRPGEGLAIDNQVITNITSFEISTDGGDKAIVEISAKILNDKTGSVKAQKAFKAVVPSNGSSNEAYVAAMDRAFASVTAELVSWSLSAF